MAEKRKKVVVRVDVPVRLDQEEYDALQRALDSPRKPSTKAIIGYFNDIIDEAIEHMVEDHPAPEEDPDADDYA
jgi:hypothetical protein